jgi:hypothetical protein
MNENLPISKKELAYKYKISCAQLRRILHDPDMLTALETKGYKKKQKFLTPAQYEIFKYLYETPPNLDQL